MSEKIVIVDENESQRYFLQNFLDAKGYLVCSHAPSQELMRLVEADIPGLVILDFPAPGRDELEIYQELLAFCIAKQIPVIYLTNVMAEVLLAQPTASGIDDFLVKPINEDILLAKIQSLLRVRSFLQSQAIQTSDLLKYQEMIDQEQLVAATLHKNILRLGFMEASVLRYSLSPKALFNGDILISAKSPSDQLFVLLGDFTGHGLSASVGAGPTAEIFYGMVRKGFSDAQIMVEINRKLHDLLPTSMFLAATLVSLSPNSSLMNVIACGLPDHLILNQIRREIRSIKSANLPLGIVNSFEPVIQHFEVSKDDYLYLFSDGLIEYENASGVQLGSDTIKTALLSPSKSHFDTILQLMEQHSEGASQNDDVTLVELHCDLTGVEWRRIEQAAVCKRKPMDWSCSFSFGPQALKQVNPVPILVNNLMEIQGLQCYQESIFQIVNELFLNAFDYGILALNGVLKHSGDGIAQYHEAKSKRLAEFKVGEIRFDFNHQYCAQGGRLTIQVQDSGSGFNIEEIIDRKDQKSLGIKKLSNLCTELEYLNGGSKVNAVFEWEY